MINAKKIGLAVLASGVMLFSTGMPTYAIAHGGGGHAAAHAGGHASTAHTAAHTAVHTSPHVSSPHTSVTHAPAVTHTSPAKATTPASRGTISASRPTFTAKANNKSAIAKSVSRRMPRTIATAKAIKKSQRSYTYRRLHSTIRRDDFVYWHAYKLNYYTRPYYQYYPWMPYWMWRSNTKESNSVKQSVKKKNMKWIKVNDKTIAVPNRIYKIIKVGDTIELTDNTHIIVNGKTYER